MLTNANDPRPGGAEGRKEAHMDGGAVASIAEAVEVEQATVPIGATRYPVAFASAFGPCAGRRLWAVSYRCPHCSGHHLGRSADAEELGGVRRARCGRLVWLVIARVYRAGVAR